jgi:phage gpG-like protein
MMLGEVARCLETKVAPQVGLYMVRQVEHTHDVQGRDEEDRTGIWPPRKMASTGLIIFGERGAVKKAIKQLEKARAKGDPQYLFRVQRNKNSYDNAQTEFRPGQLRGAKLALAEEKQRKDVQKDLKKEWGKDFKKNVSRAQRVLKHELKLALEEGDVGKAAAKRSALRLLNRPIGKGDSYARTASYLPRPVLLRTGTMKSSWTFRVERSGAKVTVFVGTPTKYARWHELGSPQRHIPIRRQVVLSRQDKGNIQALTALTLADHFRGINSGQKRR